MGEVPFPGVQIVPLSASSHDGAEFTSMLGPLDMDDSALSLKMPGQCALHRHPSALAGSAPTL